MVKGGRQVRQGRAGGATGGGSGGGSLKTVADSLNASHFRQLEPDRNVTLKDANPADRLRSGRHRCDCQARIHGLVRNCQGCGRIVCEQEGSGPCFSCGQLVCTRQERQILDRKSKKSAELFNRLMAGGAVKDIGGGGTGTGTGSGRGGLTLASLGDALTKAEQFRNTLLEADADTERRTRVHDLESDYYNMENNAYLTKEEREAIIARKEELKEMRAKLKRSLKVDIDLEKRTVTEVAKESSSDYAQDPVIQSIIQQSRQRDSSNDGKNGPQKGSFFPPFVPKYDPKYGHRSANPLNPVNLMMMSDEEVLACDDIIGTMPNLQMMYAEVERRGYAIPVDQPYASLLAVSIRRHIEWPEEVLLRGPLFIAATARAATQAELNDELARCRDRNFASTLYGNDEGGGSRMDKEYPLSYPSGAIVGRALLADCLPIEEYRQQYPQGECLETREPFVLIFSAFDPLLVPIPHMPPSGKDLYTVDKQLRVAIKHILDPYGFS